MRAHCAATTAAPPQVGGWSLPFFTVAGVSLLAAAIAQLSLAELRAEHAQLAPVRSGHKAAGEAERATILVLSCVMLGAVVYSSIDAVMPIRIAETLPEPSLCASLIFCIISVRRSREGLTLPTPARCYAACAAP